MIIALRSCLSLVLVLQPIVHLQLVLIGPLLRSSSILLLVLLDLPLSLSLNCQNLSSAVLVEHLQHQVSEFNCVMQKLVVVLFWIENGE